MRRDPLAQAAGSTKRNRIPCDSSSPWPEIEDGAVAFLLDARDDFEAGLLRIAWLPAPDAAGNRSLQDFFHGRIAEPGKARRRWLAKHRPERLACVVGDGACSEIRYSGSASAVVLFPD